jgi:hypothetical protein
MGYRVRASADAQINLRSRSGLSQPRQWTLGVRLFLGLRFLVARCVLRLPVGLFGRLLPARPALKAEGDYPTPIACRVRSDIGLITSRCWGSLPSFSVAGIRGVSSFAFVLSSGIALSV